MAIGIFADLAADFAGADFLAAGFFAAEEVFLAAGAFFFVAAFFLVAICSIREGLRKVGVFGSSLRFDPTEENGGGDGAVANENDDGKN